MISAERLADVFVEVADTLVTDFDIVDFLHTLAGRVNSICVASASGILLADESGLLRYMASSEDSTVLREVLQSQDAEGPGLDCYRTGEPVLSADLDADVDRWPAFAPAARSAGFRTAHAIPMRLRDEIIGTIVIFGSAPSSTPAASDVRIVQALADVATIAILQERNVQRAETLTEQLQATLGSRIVVEQAKGALSRYRSVTPDAAFELLREYARNNRRRLADVCHAVLVEPSTVADLIDPTQE